MGERTIVFGSGFEVASGDALELLLSAIFGDEVLIGQAKACLAAATTPIATDRDLIALLRWSFGQRLAPSDMGAPTDSLAAQALAALAGHEERSARSVAAFDAVGKPNPTAIRWPSLERDPPVSVHDVLPYVERTSLVGPHTAVAVAGSCFALEFSHGLQRHGFNYVVTEPAARAPAGIHVDGCDAENALEHFPARWGMIHNTATFRQVAERAFAVRNTPRLLVAPGGGPEGDPRSLLYSDPFRAGVFFRSQADYEADYERHRAASREALTEAEVFVMALEINECWMLEPSGPVLAAAPASGILSAISRPHCPGVEENVANLQAFIDIVRDFNPAVKIIVAVSPVPLTATTRAGDTHVIVANAHSKAVLRVAAEEIVNTNRDVHYFPAYELVTACSRDPFLADQRHLKRETAEQVLNLFAVMFVA